MMKPFLFFVFLSFTLPLTADSDVSTDISTIVSVDSWKEKEYRTDVSAYYRYRAILHNALKSESLPWLEVEKIQTGGPGSPASVKWKSRIDVTTNPDTEKVYSLICGKNAPPGLDCEAKMLCCGISHVKWDKLTLHYKMSVAGNAFSCKADNISNNDAKSTCSAVR